MALPTSVSSSSWVHLDRSELSSRPPVSTLASDKALFTPVNAAPSTESLEFLASLSESVDTLINSTTVLPKNCTSSLLEGDKLIDTRKSSPVQETEGDVGVLVKALPLPVTATLQHTTPGICSNNSTSFRCSTTDAHQHTQVSAVLYSVPLSPEENNALKICSRDIALITQSFISDTQEQSEVASTVASGVDESLRKASWDKRILENWSTSTDSNIDCESGKCEGTEIRCRKCGKIVPKAKVRGYKKAATPEQKSEKSSRSNSLEKVKRSNSKGEQQVRGNSSNKQRRGSKEKIVLPRIGDTLSSLRRHTGSRNYSAVLSACSRPIKKKGIRRTSVDVLYAREPSEPSIDKIKAKRRLSRQTDVSSFELMTLTEGAEPEDNSAAQNYHSLVVPAEEQTPLTEVLEFQMERIRTANSQLSPTNASLNDRIQELRAASSIESCPRAPWNSLETNLSSSQDTEDKYINYEPRERLPQDYQQETQEESINVDDRKMENDVCEEDAEIDFGEPSDDDAGNAEPVNGARKRRPAVKKQRKKNCVRASRVRRVHEREKGPGDWSTEVVILMALLVYLACKALNFIEFLVPARNKKKK